MKEKTKKQLRKIILTAIFILSVFGFGKNIQAAITKEISYQGKLTDENGVAVADGTYNMKISIYDASSGGSCLWTAQGSCSTPTAKSVTVANGIFSVMLGESGDNAINLDFNSAYWLGVTVGTDAEMSPRKKIGAAAYAFNSDLLDGLNSATSGADAHILATDSSGNITVSGNTTTNGNVYFNGTTYYVNSSGTGNLNALTLAGDLDVKGADITNTTGALTITPQAGTNLNVALSTTGDFAVNTSQLYVDTSAGNVGIGTSSPTNLLQVKVANSLQAIALETNATALGDYSGISFSGWGNVQKSAIGHIRTDSFGRGALAFFVNNVASSALVSTSDEVMRISQTGYVGIGTSSPSALLSVGSTSQFQVNSTGAIAAATGITSSGTITFSGLGSGLVKSTSGVLSVASAGTDYENPLTFSYPLSRATNTVSFGYNTTNLKLTSNQLNTIQDISTASAPQFARLGLGAAASASYALNVSGSSFLGHSLANVRTSVSQAPDTLDLVASRGRSTFDSISALSGMIDHFYLANQKTSYTISDNLGSVSSYLFDNSPATNDTALISSITPSTPWIIEITSSAAIEYTDVLQLVIIPHRLGNSGYFNDWKVEAYWNNGGTYEWATVLERSGVNDGGILAIPLKLTSSYYQIKGVRITVNQATGASFDTTKLYIAGLKLFNFRPTGGAAEGVGALDLAGGTLYGNFTVIDTVSTNLSGITYVGAGTGAKSLTFRTDSNTAWAGTEYLKFMGKNSSSTDKVYSNIYSSIADPTAGSEYGYLSFNALVKGVDTQHLRFAGGTATFVRPVVISDALTTADGKGLQITRTGVVSGTSYGSYSEVTGASTTNVAGYLSATGATKNYGLIVANGNVGIGTTSPGVKLAITGDTTTLNGMRTAFAITETGGYPTMQLIGSGNKKAAFRMEADGALHFYLKDSADNYYVQDERLTILPTGNIGIGTTAPTVALDVTGAVSASTYVSASGDFAEDSASVNAVTLGVTGSSARIKFDNINGTVWEIDNYDGSLRWFMPGNVLMTMDTLGNLSTSGTMKGNSTTHGIELKASGTSSSVGQIIMGSTSGYYQHSIKTVNTATASSNAIQFYLWDSGSSSDLGTLKVAEFLGDKKALFYGNVGIGQTNPTAKLHVYGDSGSTGANAPLALVAVGGIGGTGSTSDGYAGGGITLEGGIGGTSDQDYNGGVGGSVYISGGGGGEGYYDGGAGGNIYLNGGNGGTGYNNADGVSGNVVLANTRGNVRVGLGGYLNASSSDGRSLAMSAGGEYVSGWIARGTDFATMSLVAGDISFWTKTGLTSGNSFTPDQVMIIKSGGNVGIGTDSPDFKLQINGTVAPETSGQNLGDTSLRWNLNATSGNFSGGVSTSNLYVSGVGLCDQLGTLLDGEVYCVSSDRRLKTSIESLSTGNALEKVMKLRGVNFNWNDKERFGEQREVGFIAQEVEAVVPELAFTQKNGIMGVKYAQMTALLTSAIQEQQKRIEENKISVSGLELKTTDSISTLADLQKTVDDQLAKITDKFSDLKDELSERKNVEEELQKQIDELKLQTNNDLNWAKLSANTEDISYLKTLLGINADTQPGDIKILGNFQAEKITVSGVETLRMTVVNDDTHPKTIGEVEIEPVSEGGESNGKSVKIKTKAVGKKSKIFVSPKGDEPVNWIISDINEGEGFEISVDKSVEKTVAFQWWIVEEK